LGTAFIAAKKPTKIRVPALRFQGPVYERLIRPFQERRWEDMDEEYLVEGPTGTGKSVALGALYKTAMRMYPGCNLLVMRRVKADLAGSFMQMWEEEVLDPTDPWDSWMLDRGTGTIPSHRSRITYEYPNGSKLWCLGMNQWARFKSKAFDMIWCMEMTEFDEEQIEGLHTRLRARLNSPFGQKMLFGDVNPEYPQHWANRRADAKTPDGEPVSVRIKTTLRDNPGYFDRKKGQFTELGLDYLERLKKRIRDPSRRQRYIDGVWAAATGQILPWEPHRNEFDGRVVARPGKMWAIEMKRTHALLGDRVELIGFGASYDWGDVHAGALQVWGLDKQGRQYLVEEVYHSKRPPRWWADWAVRLWEKYGLQFIVCDNAAKDSIHHFNERLEEKGGARARIAIPCDKRSGHLEKNNLEVLRDLFCDQADGMPGIFASKNSLAHAPDLDLPLRRFTDEIPGYVYAEFDPSRRSGRAEDRPDRRCVDDGLDACTYFRVQLLGGRGLVTKIPEIKEAIDPYELIRRFKTGIAA